MDKLLNNLRQKSEPEKKMIAFWGAFFMTSLICLVWLMTITATNNFGTNNINSQEASPFKALFNQINSAFEEQK